MKTRNYTRAWMITFLLIVTVDQVMIAQSACPNANFSNQDFSSWQGATGDYNLPNGVNGIMPGRHTVFTAPALDANTCGGLNVIPPGEVASARLGNAGTGAEAEQLFYGMVVDPQNALFIYKYAVVLENPAGHLPTEQPEFAVRVLDQFGNQIGGNCGTYTVYGGQPGQNFQTCGGVTWLPWTTVGIDLTPFMGQQVFIEFTTKDCALGGHFGYAYICAGCSPLALTLDSCQGDTDITMVAPNGFQQYDWNPGALNGQTITVPTPAIGTVFTCTMTTFSNQGNCSVDVQVTVTPTIVQAEFLGDTVCHGLANNFLDGSTVNNGMVTSWQWNFGDGTLGNTSAPAHVYAQPGQYNVTLIATSDQGCSDTISNPIIVHATPTAAFLVDGSCTNDLVTFLNQSAGLAPLASNWNFGDGATSFVQSPTHQYLNANAYTTTLIVTDGNDCSDTAIQQNTIFNPPAVDAGPDQFICPGQTTTVNASGALNYSWNQGLQNNVPFLLTQPSYCVVTGWDANGCMNTDSLFVDYYPVSSVDAGVDQTVCEGDSVSLLASGSVSYSWSNGQQNGDPFVPMVGNSVFEVIGTDVHGCSDTDQVTVITNPLPPVNAGPDAVVCRETPILLQASGAVSYVWSNGSANNTTFIPNGPTTLAVTGTSAAGCSATDSVSFTFDTYPVILPAFSVNSGCVPLQTDLSVGLPGYHVHWNFGDGNASTGSPVSHTYQTDGCFDVTVEVVSPIGCTYDTVLMTAICVFPNPHALFQPSPYIMSELDPTTTMQNASIGATSYSWDFGDGSFSNLTDPSHTYSETPGSYEIILTAISDHGCTDTAMATVLVEEELIYYVPNTFTPDGDKHNQIFLPVIESGFDPDSYRFFIFNRWGQLVFESKDILVGWDGTFDGFQAQDGTYTWKIEFKSTLRRQVDNVITGHVNVLR
ncbi:MAG: PKD domain-containing protein [Fluviicola sp.]